MHGRGRRRERHVTEVGCGEELKGDGEEGEGRRSRAVVAVVLCAQREERREVEENGT